MTEIIRLNEIVFTDGDRKNKGMRKDFAYMMKIFGENLPKWLVDRVMTIWRNQKSLELLSKKEVF